MSKLDEVLVKKDKIDSITPPYNLEPFVLIAMKGSMVAVAKGETILCRNIANVQNLEMK